VSLTTFSPNPVRVLFGPDCVDALADEAARLAMTRCLVLCTPTRTNLADALAARLPPAKVCDAARPNFPESAFAETMAAIRDFDANGMVAVGGGTPIGLGKAIAAATRLPVIAIPTTYSGSELASNWYVGSGDRKRSGNDQHALPATVLYDPKLTIALPPSTTAASGMNAMAHAVETLYGADLNPAAAVMAKEAVRLLGKSLVRCVDRPNDLEARTEALKGAWFAAGFRAGRGLSHTMAQRVRDAFALDHGQCHAIALPYAVAFNAPAANEAMRAIADGLGVPNAALGLYDMNKRLGLPTGFRDLGMPSEGVGHAATAVAAAKLDYPRPVSGDDAYRIIEAAFAGEPPEGV